MQNQSLTDFDFVCNRCDTVDEKEKKKTEIQMSYGVFSGIRPALDRPAPRRLVASSKFMQVGEVVIQFNLAVLPFSSLVFIHSNRPKDKLGIEVGGVKTTCYSWVGWVEGNPKTSKKLIDFKPSDPDFPSRLDMM